MAVFPDYGKAAPEYLLTVTELLASYPVEVQRAVCDPKTGIVAGREFLPPGPVIVKFADEVQSRLSTKPQVTIAEGTDQWEAWRKHRGRSFPTTDIKPADGGSSFKGWYFPSDWPPGYTAPARSLD